MLVSAPIAPVAGVSPEAYRRFLQNQIIFYPDQLLACGEYVVLYSGPTRGAFKAVGAKVQNNNARSQILAIALGASRINNTEMAKFLDKQNLNVYFQDYLAARHTDLEYEVAQQKAYATVWGGPSEILVQRDFMKAATVVCGAAKDRVFAIDEMQPLLENPNNKFTNEIPTLAPKRMLGEVSKDASFDLICRSELKLVQTLAQCDVANFMWWNQDFKERVGFYAYERGLPSRAALTPSQEDRKKAIIKDFKLEALYATHPQTWVCKLPAGAKAPAKAPILSLV